MGGRVLFCRGRGSAAASGAAFVRLAVLGILPALLAACTSVKPPDPVIGGQPDPVIGGQHARYVVPPGIHKIKHVIIVMQENRSFDSYFGTYPGADGIPMRHGVPTVCVPNPASGCTRPYHDTADKNGDGPHGRRDAAVDVNNGKMDGFIRQRDAAMATCRVSSNPACSDKGPPDVMGYHTAAEIPNYWAYAGNFTLDDHMFEPVRSWSLAEHLYIVSGWSARCRNRSPMSCHNDVDVYRSGAFNQLVDEELATGK